MKRQAPLRGRTGYLAELVALALGYVALGRVGLAASPVSGFATLVWPPAGLCLAALVIGGYRLWPGIAAGALATNLWLGAPPPTAFAMAAGNAIAATLGAFALQRAVGTRHPFERSRDVLALAVPAALGSTAVGATVGTVSLALGGVIAQAALAQAWLVWWLGDLTSVVVVAPFVLTWARPPRAAPARTTVEVLALGALLLAGAAFVFGQRPDTLARMHVVTSAVLLPPLIWAAFRFGPRGAATASFALAVAAVWGTATGHGNFARVGLVDGLLNLHGTLAVQALVALTLGAAVAERERALEAIRDSGALTRAIMDGSTDIIFVKDRRGRYLFVNAAGARLLGRSPEALLGQEDTAFFPALEARRLREADEEVMRSAEPLTIDEVLTVPGEPRLLQSVKVPYRSGAGAVLGVIGITRDVTEQKSAEQARARLAAIVESSADAIIANTLDGTITSWNAAAERLYGYPPGEAIGEPLAMVVPVEERGQLASLLERVGDGEHVVNHETVRRRKDGGRIEVALTLSPIRDAAGTVIGASTIARDITECAERWRLATEAAHIGMWCWTMKGDRFAWTPACRRSHGIGPSEDGSYARFAAAIHPDDRERVERAVARSIAEHADYRVTYRAQHPDGRVRWISASGCPLYDGHGEAKRMLGVAIDVTADKQAEEERAELLARERAARAEAESAARAKDEFLAIVSHELRTPLQSMLGWAVLLKGRPADLPTLRRGLDTIERNVKTQAQLIEDLLDVSRIVAGKLRLERRRVDLAEVLRAALDSATMTADSRRIRLEAAIEPAFGEVLGDPQRLQQIVSNLVSNALKFTPEGGRVRVRLEREGPTATIAVEDSGCGIPPAFLPYVFDRFRQAEEGENTTTTRKRGGLGIGLTIVRHLVEAHGGTVRAQSPGEGLGATFTVTLPLVSGERRALTEERAEPSWSAESSALVLDGVRILVVDDDQDARDLLETVLQQEGADVHAVPSARAALDELASFCPNVLLSDIGMPDEDGYALIRELRQQEASTHRAHVPALALTAFASAADRALALSLGFEAHLAKPASPRDLARMVASLVGREPARAAP